MALVQVERHFVLFIFQGQEDTMIVPFCKGGGEGGVGRYRKTFFGFSFEEQDGTLPASALHSSAVASMHSARHTPVWREVLQKKDYESFFLAPVCREKRVFRAICTAFRRFPRSGHVRARLPTRASFSWDSPTRRRCAARSTRLRRSPQRCRAKPRGPHAAGT